MATFTIVLKDALEIEPDIGLLTYPIFDETYRAGLNQKIVDHFWNMEIGQETIEMFKLALRRKMNEIMPYYNQHYVASKIQFDPLETVNIKNIASSTGNTTSTGSSSNTSTSNAESRAVASETPQTRLAGNEDYATAAQDNASATTAGGTAEDTNTTDQNGNTDGTTQGFSGSYALTLMELRQSFVNVDMMIINELESLFMLVWDNGDEFSERQYPYYGYYGYGFGLPF